ncbi:hypothetical protein P9112_014492 [Eukaryota sp. TZLM1-RC]
MRLRCFLWPCSLPNDLICRCKSVVTLSHILNCKYFITYRSLVHDSVRDQLYAMCKSFNIEAFIEPLVRKLSSDQTDDSFGKRRADLVAPGIDGVLNVVDVVSVDVCKNSAARLVYSADSPLSNAEKKKIKKYEEPLAQLGRVEHVKYQFVPFAISLFGNIGPSGLHYLENFKKVLLNRSGKTMNSTFWLNRIVFCIFKSIPTMISKALLAIGVEYERNAVSRFSNSDASRLIALVKPGNGIKPDGIRPIAVGESLSRLLASIVFDRVKDKAYTFLNPHQFGIKTIDGASVAAIASDTFFNAEENNFIFNLDFKNAFNSVKREAIFEVIKSDFPELSKSDLIFNSFGLKSSSGVKQGDPLGPLLFCLAIHKTLNIIKQKYPSIKIVAYMDDISLIGSFDLLELVAQEIADSYENIGLHLNASKCLLIGSSAQDLVINDSIVPFTNYSSDAFKFLGCWLGNVPQIQNELQGILEKMKIELDSISSLDIEKHIKFFMLKICYTGRITHILRSCAPSIALDFCRSFNSLRTEFFC